MLVLGVAATAGAWLAAAPADAAGGLATTTTLTVTPASSITGQAVTLSATVSFTVLPSLGILPTGTVTFSSSNGLTSVPAGSATLGNCSLTACSATITTSSLPVGTTSVKASYGGDGLAAPSSTTKAATVAPNPSPGDNSTVNCYAGQPCSTGQMSSTSGSQKANVTADASANPQTVSASFSSTQLHCQTKITNDNDNDEDDGVPFPGDLITFSSTASDAGKTLTYTGTGSLAALMYHEYHEHTKWVGCFGAPHQFKGYVNGVYTNAVFVAGDGLYEAQPSNCSLNGGAKPCFTDSGNTSSHTYTVKAAAGDPKFIG